MTRSALARSALVVGCGLALVAPVVAEDDWVIDRFDAKLAIQPDGTFTAYEAIDADFRDSPHHGIFRDVTYELDYGDQSHLRKYEITLLGVTAADGRRHQVATSTDGYDRRFKIGDPNKLITGKETYRLSYRVAGALNAFVDHDELYWNATGANWAVPLEEASVVVDAPGGAIERIACFQGPRGSTESCASSFVPAEARFHATRPLRPGEQLTIVAGLRKGAVAEPRPILVSKPRDAAHLFDLDVPMVAASGALLVAVVGGLGTLWWRVGRDRRYLSMHYLSHDDAQERVPFFSPDQIVVEFEPPEKIRPGQMGVLLDERADTLDVTATIIDLAVRGYLSIAEVPKTWMFGHNDWQLTQLKPADAQLLDYEQIVLNGLFEKGSPRLLSELKNKFYKDLASAQTALYADAVERGWFPRNPNSVRGGFLALGVFAIVAGVFLTIGLGALWGAALLGLPVIVGGFLMAVMSGAMPRRTAAGREMMRRTLGFMRYMKTAETQQQAFAERANIFTSYLPFAIVFRCVDKWARAFRDIDLQRATAGWYAGTTPFNPASFSSSVSSFSSSVSTAIASTPGGSGGSGFSGGSSGGGGGGGGGGGW